MQRRTLLTRLAACLLTPLAIKLLRVQSPKVSPIHVTVMYWNKQPDAIIDASIAINGTEEQLQAYYAAETRAYSQLGIELVNHKPFTPTFTSPFPPRRHMVRLIHGQRDPDPRVRAWALAAAETLSRVGCTMTVEAAEALAACTNPNDPKAIQES